MDRMSIRSLCRKGHSRLPVFLLLLLLSVLWASAIYLCYSGAYRMPFFNHKLQIYILMEPPHPCDDPTKVPVIIMVASDAIRKEYRMAVRATWAKFQPTFFVMGLYPDERPEVLDETFVEGKKHKDLLVFDLQDRYHNQSLKTSLMLSWIRHRCDKVKFLFKTDDDVMVNPLALQKVILDNYDAQLVGYTINDTSLVKDHSNEWYIRSGEYLHIPTYLSGTGYLVRGELIKKILDKAYHMPIINMEDVYFTYIVAHRELGFKLTHDSRLRPFKPWPKNLCVYYNLASVHSFQPMEMITAWAILQDSLVQTNKKCSTMKSIG